MNNYLSFQSIRILRDSSNSASKAVGIYRAEGFHQYFRIIVVKGGCSTTIIQGLDCFNQAQPIFETFLFPWSFGTNT